MMAERHTQPGTRGTSASRSSRRTLSMGMQQYQQEYCCEFVEQEDMVFSYDEIEKAVRPDMPRASTSAHSTPSSR